MVGVLQRREVDLSFAQFSITNDRSKAISFSLPYNVETVAIFMRKPLTRASAKFNAYFKDFGVDFWTTLGITIVILSVAFVLLDRFEKLHPVSSIFVWHSFQ